MNINTGSMSRDRQDRMLIGAILVVLIALVGGAAYLSWSMGYPPVSVKSHQAYAGSDNNNNNEDEDNVLHNTMTHANVRLALLDNVGIDALRIDIDVSGTDVALEGAVMNRETVELAKRIAASVDGVEDVKVDLEIAEENREGAMGEASSELSDAVLESKVKVALMTELGTNAFGIDVATADGVVVLSGKVETDERRTLAVATVKDVTGVKDVRDLLESTPS